MFFASLPPAFLCVDIWGIGRSLVARGDGYSRMSVIIYRTGLQPNL